MLGTCRLSSTTTPGSPRAARESPPGAAPAGRMRRVMPASWSATSTCAGRGGLREPVGSSLVRSLEQAVQDARQTLVWATYDSVPAGEAFSRRVGARVVRVNRTSELRLSSVDWEMVRSWIDDGSRARRATASSSGRGRSRPTSSTTPSCSTTSCKRHRGTTGRRRRRPGRTARGRPRPSTRRSRTTTMDDLRSQTRRSLRRWYRGHVRAVATDRGAPTEHRHRPCSPRPRTCKVGEGCHAHANPRATHERGPRPYR